MHNAMHNTCEGPTSCSTPVSCDPHSYAVPAMFRMLPVQAASAAAQLQLQCSFTMHLACHSAHWSLRREARPQAIAQCVTHSSVMQRTRILSSRMFHCCLQAIFAAAQQQRQCSGVWWRMQGWQTALTLTAAAQVSRGAGAKGCRFLAGEVYALTQPHCLLKHVTPTKAKARWNFWGAVKAAHSACRLDANQRTQLIDSPGAVPAPLRCQQAVGALLNYCSPGSLFRHG